MFNVLTGNPIKVTVWFNTIQAMHEFDDHGACCCVPQKWLTGVRTITGGFDDGHATIIYPCRWNKVKEIERRIRTFNRFARHFELNFEAKRVG